MFQQLKAFFRDESGGVMEWALTAGVMGLLFYGAYQLYIKPNYDAYAQKWGHWLNPN